MNKREEPMSRDEVIELLPCPFCGGAGEIISAQEAGSGRAALIPCHRQSERTPRMSDKKLRVDQRKNEAADIFVLRALATAYPMMNDNQKIALARYVGDRVSDDIRRARK